ncbi:MAG: hypothetical protein HYS27_17670 [Deltaproteobacteria bacterium]|nr:hypothetical protein [Deltaproteobacteria bacterium]
MTTDAAGARGPAAMPPAVLPTSTFWLALCAPGAEKTLAAGVAAAGLRLAFSRKGVVTLKAPGALAADARLDAPLARFAAPCFGRAGELHDDVRALARVAGAPVRLHVLDTAADAAWQEADALRAALAAELRDVVREGERPEPGDHVVTVVLIDGTPWLTLHRHALFGSPWPGGRPRVTIAAPDQGGPPSRAYLKLREVLERAALEPRPGERALEIGAAPGGAAMLLLELGLDVVGVDPNEMDARVAAHPRFVHVRTPSTQLEPSRIAGPFHWLLVDVNVPPGTALRGALPFVAAHVDTLRGVVFTLKLKQWSMVAELPDWLRRLERAAPRLAFTATSVASHGQELVAVGRRVQRGR